MEATHKYESAIVGLSDTPSAFVKARATARFLLGDRPTLTGETGNVIHFQVPSGTRTGHVHRVEYDKTHQTFRCSCEANFYGNACTHVRLTEMCVNLT